MGMFDYVFVPKGKLPVTERELSDLKDEPFQTKDFDCVMTEIYITEDGLLQINNWAYELVPEAERPYPNDPGILGAIGMLRRTNERLDTIPFHGEFHFYAIGKSEEWYEFMAKFTDGKLVDIIRIGRPGAD